MPHSGRGERAMAHNNATHEEAGCARSGAEPVMQEPISTEHWQRRYLRQLDLLEAETRYLPSVSRQAAQPGLPPYAAASWPGSREAADREAQRPARVRMTVALS